MSSSTPREADFDVATLHRMYVMVRSMLDEVRAVDPDSADDASRARVATLLQVAIIRIGAAVPEELLAELGRLVRPARSDDPTVHELRVVDALIVGWLRGLGWFVPAPGTHGGSPAPQTDDRRAEVGYL